MKNYKNKKGLVVGWFWTYFKNLLFLFAGICVILGGIIIIWLSSFKMPDFRAFDERKVINSTKIFDRTGEILLYDVHEDIKRTNISFEEMGSNIKNATVAIEDSEFYNHSGIRVISTLRAIFSNITNIGIGGGGSTITQQLVKNTLLTKESGLGRYVRKLKEWVLSVKIDRSMSKEKILEHYLNEIPYGGNIYGIQEASKTYLNKDAFDLTIAEAAYLASIPQSPTVLSPYGKNRDKLEDRKNLVLYRMLEVGFITKEEYELAKNEVVSFVPRATAGIRAPHFVFFIKQYLEEKYGNQVVEGGLKVTTTIDWNLQARGEQIVKEGALLNEKEWGGKNSALVAIDPKTGQILTMVGSRDYFDTSIDGNFNVSTAERQPGSSFKPFIYATAFNKGFTPSTVLFDLFTEFSSTCDAYGNPLPGRDYTTCYSPKNYDGKFRGPISLRSALAESINVPAVKLFYLAGMKDSFKIAQDMGITTLTDINRYGLTLVIGGGEVTLLDMTSAYGVFANNGTRNPYTGILKVETSNGTILEEYENKSKIVLPKNTALTISDILSDNKARTPTFGTNSPLLVKGYDVAVKTGTTNDNKDAWIIGYSPSLVVGVWAGNNDNIPMKKGGSAMAGPIWNKFISEALSKFPNEKFESPSIESNPEKLSPVLRGLWQGNDSFFIDSISGKLATQNTPQETKIEKVLTDVHTILYWVDKDNITGPSPKNPNNDPQFTNWETSVKNWWLNNSHYYQITTKEQIPTEYDDVHTAENTPNVFVIEPNNQNIYRSDQKIQLKITNLNPTPLKKIDIFINDIYLGTSEPPFIFSFVPKDLENLKKENTIKIVSYDNVYNRGENKSIFFVEEESF
ncbi:MAG: transglycosylase domain-containing protein [Candidatus Paceibacterota bacterium]|jgi:penicillin-binding protein 1C